MVLLICHSCYVNWISNLYPEVAWFLPFKEDFQALSLISVHSVTRSSIANVTLNAKLDLSIVTKSSCYSSRGYNYQDSNLKALQWAYKYFIAAGQYNDKQRRIQRQESPKTERDQPWLMFAYTSSFSQQKE